MARSIIAMGFQPVATYQTPNHPLQYFAYLTFIEFLNPLIRRIISNIGRVNGILHHIETLPAPGTVTGCFIKVTSSGIGE